MKQLSPFAKNLKRMRGEAGMSYRELGAKSGTTPSYLSDLEKDQGGNISLQKAEALANALGCHVSELVDKPQK